MVNMTLLQQGVLANLSLAQKIENKGKKLA